MKLQHRASHWEGDQLMIVWYWSDRPSEQYATRTQAYRERFVRSKS